jgi:hypothetical protein
MMPYQENELDYMSLQVLGATNYTHWADAHRVRACSGAGRLQRQLQEAAIARLSTFAHVGIMEDLDASMLSLAASMGLKLDGPAWKVIPLPICNVLRREAAHCLLQYVAHAGKLWRTWMAACCN